MIAAQGEWLKAIGYQCWVGERDDRRQVEWLNVYRVSVWGGGNGMIDAKLSGRMSIGCQWGGTG